MNDYIDIEQFESDLLADAVTYNLKIRNSEELRRQKTDRRRQIEEHLERIKMKDDLGFFNDDFYG